MAASESVTPCLSPKVAAPTTGFSVVPAVAIDAHRMTAKGGQEDWRALSQQGIALIQRGLAPRAIAELTRAQHFAPDDGDVLYWLGNASRMTCDTARAAAS